MPERTSELFDKALECALGHDWTGAGRHCAKALSVNSRDAHALHLIGAACSCQGDLKSAEEFLQQAVALKPRQSTWHRDLGIVRVAAQRWPEALEALERSVALDSGDERTLGLYARALWQVKRFRRARVAYDRWSAALPGVAEPIIGSARCLAELDRPGEAVDRAHAALALEPNSIAGHQLLAEIQLCLQCYEAELFHRLKLVKLTPDDSHARALCACAWYRCGETDKAVSVFRIALARGVNADLHAAFLAILLHHGGSSAELLREEHQIWARTHKAARAPKAIFRNSPLPERKLRIGYLSGEPVHSPVFYFLTPFFRNHDRRAFGVTLYYTDPSLRGCTDQFQLRPNESRDVTNWTWKRVAEQIRRDRIDVLVDTSGHFGGGTLLVPALRAAPIQVSFPSYPGTTGLPEMDYLLTDQWTCPAGQEQQYTEQAYHLPSGYLVYTPPARAPRVGALPASETGAITFGVFQRPAKLNPDVWDAIAEVLKRVPRARLLVHFTSADLDIEGSQARLRVESALESRGIAAGRAFFRGARSLNRHLAVLSGADVALDSFPYSGQTTTCECLWMGVPVVTLAGKLHVSRVSAGLLLRAGMDSCVAASVHDYVRIAVDLATDHDRLASLRKGLRKRVAASTLTDGARITGDLEDAFRRMWLCWLRSR